MSSLSENGFLSVENKMHGITKEINYIEIQFQTIFKNPRFVME